MHTFTHTFPWAGLSAALLSTRRLPAAVFSSVGRARGWGCVRILYQSGILAWDLVQCSPCACWVPRVFLVPLCLLGFPGSTLPAGFSGFSWFRCICWVLQVPLVPLCLLGALQVLKLPGTPDIWLQFQRCIKALLLCTKSTNSLLWSRVAWHSY